MQMQCKIGSQAALRDLCGICETEIRCVQLAELLPGRVITFVPSLNFWV